METATHRLLLRLVRSSWGRFQPLITRQARRLHYRRAIHFNQLRNYSGLALTIPFTLIPSVMAATSQDNKAIVDKVEEMYEKKQFMEMYDLLIPHKDSTDAEILWRLARAATEKGKILGGDDRKRLIYEAFDYANKALEIDDKNFACHKWVGILLDYTAEYEGNKKRISNAYIVKERFMKAIELNPKDATTMYCLGLWCFLFADMAWYERKIASVVFASPPTSSYDEAMSHFKSAEEAEPGFYNQNLVMIGKTYMRQKKWDDAKDYLLRAQKHEVETADDKKAKEEAEKLLKEMKVKF